jgi:hypothetical protein
MELRRSSKFENSLGCSIVKNVLKSCANEIAWLELRATPKLKFFLRTGLRNARLPFCIYFKKSKLHKVYFGGL